MKIALLLLLFAAPATAVSSEESLRESVVRLTAGDAVGARAAAEAAVRGAPRSPRALQQLALAALAVQDFTAAEVAAGRALDAGGPAVALLTIRSRARSGQGDVAGALADATRAADLAPGSGPAQFARAVALEGSGRRQDAAAAYLRAAELDASLCSDAERARVRLAPASPPRAGNALGQILAALAVSLVAGWAWGRREEARRPPAPVARRRPVLAGRGKLAPRAALAALSAASDAEFTSEEVRALAESLYERLTGRPAFPRDLDRSLGRFLPASELARALPSGADAFFARALHPDAEKRFATAAELTGAFRSVVVPPVS